MSELKKCPFCGGCKIVNEEELNVTLCYGCSAETDIFDWNNRPIEDALNARIAELEAAQRWIPVSERLPENENDQVLIRRGNVVALGWIYFDALMGDWDYRCYDEDWDGNPTHWMPLPKFPEVQE